MTIPDVGRVTPLQIRILMFAGYKLTRMGTTRVEDLEAHKEFVLSTWRSLIKAIGADRGAELMDWHEDLKKFDEYTHPYAFKSVELKMREAADDLNYKSFLEDLFSEHKAE